MPTEVIIKNTELDRRGIGEIVVNPPIADGEQEKFLLYHGIEQVKTHAGLSADIEVNNFNSDAWGASGKGIGRELNRLIQERNEPTFGTGCSVIGFGEDVSIAAIKQSQNPATHLYFDTEGLYNERDIEISDKVKGGVKDFFDEFASNMMVELFLLSSPFHRFRAQGSMQYGGSLADLHHRTEDLFKATFNAVRQYKARLSTGLGGDPSEPRRAYLISSHGEAEMGCFINLDGRGEAVVQLSSSLDRNYLSRFKNGQKLLAKRGMLDIILACGSIGRHHTIEDLGIPQGQAFSQAVKSNTSRLIRFGNDFYIDDKKFVLASVGVSNRYSFIGNFTPEFMRMNDTTLHYLEQMLQDARWETYLHVGSPDFQQMSFNDKAAYEILHEVIKPNSPYRRPVNTIIPYEEQVIEDPSLALFYVIGGAIRMGTRIDRSQPEGVASSKGVIY